MKQTRYRHETDISISNKYVDKGVLNMSSPKQYEVKRDANGTVCVRVSCTPLKNTGIYNVRITIGVDAQYNIARFYYINPQTKMFVPVEMEAQRRGIELYACIYALVHEHVPVYQEVTQNMRFVTADAYFNGKTFVRADNGMFCTLVLQKPAYKTVVGANKELWVLNKVIPAPEIFHTYYDHFATTCLSAAYSMVAT